MSARRHALTRRNAGRIVTRRLRSPDAVLVTRCARCPPRHRPPRDRGERALAGTLRRVPAPVGVAVFAVAPLLLGPLYLVRAVFCVVGLLWLAALLVRRAPPHAEG